MKTVVLLASILTNQPHWPSIIIVYRRSNRALSMRDRVDSSTHVASSDSDEEEKEEEETPVDEEEMSTAGVVNSSFSSSSLNSSGLLLVSSMAINTSDNAVHASFLRIISTAA